MIIDSGVLGGDVKTHGVMNENMCREFLEKLSVLLFNYKVYKIDVALDPWYSPLILEKEMLSD